MMYLATELHHSIPKSLLPHVPMGELLNGVATNGLAGYLAMVQAVDKQEQVRSLYEEGKTKTSGRPTLSEYKSLVVKSAYTSIEGNSTLDVPQKLRLYSQANQYLSSTSIIQDEMFNPFDADTQAKETLDFPTYGILSPCILGRIPYGSLGFIAAETKTGKTSVSIKWAMEGLYAGIFKNMVYVSLEMKKASVYRIFNNFTDLPKGVQGRAITGTQYPSQIQTELENQGLAGKETFVIYDSPDVLVQVTGGMNATLQYNAVMGELVQLSQSVGMLVCTSQVVRGVEGMITSTSQLSLSNTKGQYADFVVGLHRPDHTKPLMQLTGVVNRNDGVGGCTVNFNHRTLTYTQAQAPIQNSLDDL